jgi:hypothetical protein
MKETLHVGIVYTTSESLVRLILSYKYEGTLSPEFLRANTFTVEDIMISWCGDEFGWMITNI